MDYDGNGTLYHLNCGICGRTFWSHDAFESVCDDCKYSNTPILYPNGYLESKNGDVEIVRCKDCKYRNFYCIEATDGTALYECHHPCANSVPRPGDWFCADGKREEDE